jgi:hypothetical protein
MSRDTWSATVYGAEPGDPATIQNRLEFMYRYGRCRFVPPCKELLKKAFGFERYKKISRSELLECVRQRCKVWENPVCYRYPYGKEILLMSPVGPVSDEDVPPGWQRVPPLYSADHVTLMYDTRPYAHIYPEYMIHPPVE